MNSLLRWIGKALGWTLKLIGWFIRYTLLIVFAMMVFSMFVGGIFYVGYEIGYMDGMNDVLQQWMGTPNTTET